MKKWMLLIILLVISTSSHAAKMRFGIEETIHSIQAVEITGANGESLDLAYKTKARWFIAGVYLKDDGYILSVRGEAGRYYRLDRQQITEFQNAGYLPSPLPSYRVNVWDYVFGYSIWVVVLFTAIWSLLAEVMRRRRQAKSIPAQKKVDKEELAVSKGDNRNMQRMEETAQATTGFNEVLYVGKK